MKRSGACQGLIDAEESVEISLSFDEVEALRLADLEGLYQEQAAEQMNVSRQTFACIVKSARKKVDQAIFEGRALILRPIETGHGEGVEVRLSGGDEYEKVCVLRL